MIPDATRGGGSWNDVGFLGTFGQLDAQRGITSNMVPGVEEANIQRLSDDPGPKLTCQGVKYWKVGGVPEPARLSFAFSDLKNMNEGRHARLAEAIREFRLDEFLVPNYPTTLCRHYAGKPVQHAHLVRIGQYG